VDNPAAAPIPGYTGTADGPLQQYWLDVAWRQLQREDRTLVARIESGEIDTDTVADVVMAAARRVLRNPEGFESESGAIDDYTEALKRADATEDVYFTAAELRRLQSVDAATAVLGGWSGSTKYC
jgi:hypothetical protein